MRSRCCPSLFFHILVCRVIRFFFFQAEDGIRDDLVTGVQTCALPIFLLLHFRQRILGGFGARCTGGRLSFAADLGHLRGDFLSQRRTVKLQQSLDFVLDRKSVV